jgi:hypothetical protein
MAVSKKCEQCSKVKRCRMFVEKRDSFIGGRLVMMTSQVYLCAPCARELGYAGA